MVLARLTTLALAILAAPGLVRADVTVIYAPAAPPPLVARPVEGASPVTADPAAAPALPEEQTEAEPVAPAARRDECVPPPLVEIVRVVAGEAPETARLVLTDCRARPDAPSVATLARLARPAGSATSTEVPLHPGLAERLRAIADRFPGHRIEIVAGYRPDAPEDSRHHHGLALDVRVVGVSLDAVAELARTFPRTGVGVSRAANLLHLDVRAARVHWSDAAEPGELPRVERETRAAPPEREEDPRHLVDEAFRILDGIRVDVSDD